MKRPHLQDVISKIAYGKTVLNNLGTMQYVSSNRKYKNIHNGKRCFVFGNGPSIKELDFSDFADEIVFTVNQIARNEQFPKLKTNYHFWADSCFFNLDLTKEENIELLNQMTNVNTNNNEPECFFPVQHKIYLEETGLTEKLKVNYYLPGYSLKYFQEKANRFDKIIPGFFTVVQYAIFLADYMGCSEIYLLGCETTSILTSIKSRLDNDLSGTYGYELSQNEIARINNLREYRTYASELFSDYHTIDDYAILAHYCYGHGHKLVNCTPVSLIEGVSRKSIKEVLG